VIASLKVVAVSNEGLVVCVDLVGGKCGDDGEAGQEESVEFEVVGDEECDQEGKSYEPGYYES